MCVNAPVTLSSPLNNLVISRLFNLLQPISTLFNYLCLVTEAHEECRTPQGVRGLKLGVSGRSVHFRRVALRKECVD